VISWRSAISRPGPRPAIATNATWRDDSPSGDCAPGPPLAQRMCLQIIREQFWVCSATQIHGDAGQSPTYQVDLGLYSTRFSLGQKTHPLASVSSLSPLANTRFFFVASPWTSPPAKLPELCLRAFLAAVWPTEAETSLMNCSIRRCAIGPSLALVASCQVSLLAWFSIAVKVFKRRRDSFVSAAPYGSHCLYTCSPPLFWSS